MMIGIDISQIVFEGTGVGRYVKEMVRELAKQDASNTFILFGASLRKQAVFQNFFESLPDSARKRTSLKILPIPISLLEFVWNRLHIFPIEWILGPIDIFWSSDWTQPPLKKAKGVTTIHDLAIYRFPESFPEHIVAVHKRKLDRSKRICAHFFCDSDATKKDAHELLHIPLKRMSVIYPGYRKV